MNFETALRKKRAVKDDEANGRIADSMAVRLDIVRRMERGEITPEQGQAELKRIKRNAKKNGKITREQSFRQG